MRRLRRVCRAGASAGLKPCWALEGEFAAPSAVLEALLTRARCQCLLRGSLGRSCHSPALVDGLYLRISRLSWLFFPPRPKNSPSRSLGSATLLKWISARGPFPVFSLSLCWVIFAVIKPGVYGTASPPQTSSRKYRSFEVISIIMG